MINIKRFKPQHGQDIIARVKHGYISGYWDNEELVGRTYLLGRELQFHVEEWIPFEDFENFAFDRDILSDELDDAFSYLENHKDNQWKD